MNSFHIFRLPGIESCWGGVFMCRRNVFFAGVLIAFGVGLLIGSCMESGFIPGVVGFGVVVGGFFFLKR